MIEYMGELGYSTYAGLYVVGIAESDAPMLFTGDRGGAIRACWDDRDLRYGSGNERLGWVWRGDGTV
jgi:hypothetical protein